MCTFSFTFSSLNKTQIIKLSFALVSFADFHGDNTGTANDFSSYQDDTNEHEVGKEWAVAHHPIGFLPHWRVKMKSFQCLLFF